MAFFQGCQRNSQRTSQQCYTACCFDASLGRIGHGSLVTINLFSGQRSQRNIIIDHCIVSTRAFRNHYSTSAIISTRSQRSGFIRNYGFIIVIIRIRSGRITIIGFRSVGFRGRGSITFKSISIVQDDFVCAISKNYRSGNSCRMELIQ